MMTKLKLADVKDIPEGKSIIVKIPDGREVALFKVEGQIHALENVCPHMGGPLGEGCLDGYKVACPWHGWEFDVRNGTCENMLGDDARSIPIMVEEGSIFLDV